MVFTRPSNLLNVPSPCEASRPPWTASHPHPPGDVHRDLPHAARPSPPRIGFDRRGQGHAPSPGVPIELNESGTDQNVCENLTYHFMYSGSAQYTDSTSTNLTFDPQPRDLGAVGDLHGHGERRQPRPDSSLPRRDGELLQVPDLDPVRLRRDQPPRERDHRGRAAKPPTAPRPSRWAPPIVEAVYPASGTDFNGSVSNVVAQVVNVSLLRDEDRPHLLARPLRLGSPVTLTATVSKTSGSGRPAARSPSAWAVREGRWSAPGCSMPAVRPPPPPARPGGDDNLYAVYSGDTHFSGFTSPVRVQTRDRPRRPRAPGRTPTSSTATCPSRSSTGPTGLTSSTPSAGATSSTATTATTASAPVTETTGSPTAMATTWSSGATATNTISAGNGNDQIVVGNGSNAISAGNGNDTVSVGNGSHNQRTLGNGTDTITVGTGISNSIDLGNGTDTVTVTSPSVALTPTHDRIDGGNGNETIHLGSGVNSYSGRSPTTPTFATCRRPPPRGTGRCRPTTTTPSPTARW